jgi:hypothetical protein
MKTVNRQFVRHYIEMVVVMFAGMAVLGVPAGWLLEAAGTSYGDLAPSPMLLLMAFTMTAPMVAWMIRKGHGWKPNAEMAASMVIPALAAVALHETAILQDVSTLMVLEHVAMLVAMFGVMLLRPEEYSHHNHGAAHGSIKPELAA